MNEIKSVAKSVKNILTTHPNTRNSDSYLYYVICKQRLDAIGINIDKISLSQSLLYRKGYNLPPFETVRRTRQKLQEHHPELRGTDEVEEARTYLEEEYRDYARGSAV
jgi:hypothetical protein